MVQQVFTFGPTFGQGRLVFYRGNAVAHITRASMTPPNKPAFQVYVFCGNATTTYEMQQAAVGTEHATVAAAEQAIIDGTDRLARRIDALRVFLATDRAAGLKSLELVPAAHEILFNRLPADRPLSGPAPDCPDADRLDFLLEAGFVGRKGHLDGAHIGAICRQGNGFIFRVYYTASNDPPFRVRYGAALHGTIAETEQYLRSIAGELAGRIGVVRAMNWATKPWPSQAVRKRRYESAVKLFRPSTGPDPEGLTDDNAVAA